MTTITEPGQLHAAWAERFNAGDVQGLLDLAEPDGALVSAPSQLVRGEDMTVALEHFLALKLPITMTVRNVYAIDDLALVVTDWSISGTGPDGSPVELSGSSADVLRNGPDGWKFAIDVPFGTA
ncbi:YybH family protein [Streptomyces tubercidicus]|uniref:YybH family protein n=1 Tax=Streptomyces tubercidicus TaxID=47759 RepID=UPI003465F094